MVNTESIDESTNATTKPKRNRRTKAELLAETLIRAPSGKLVRTCRLKQEAWRMLPQTRVDPESEEFDKICDALFIGCGVDHPKMRSFIGVYIDGKRVRQEGWWAHNPYVVEALFLSYSPKIWPKLLIDVYARERKGRTCGDEEPYVYMWYKDKVITTENNYPFGWVFVGGKEQFLDVPECWGWNRKTYVCPHCQTAMQHRRFICEYCEWNKYRHRLDLQGTAMESAGHKMNMLKKRGRLEYG